jgi:hypothetical protein
LLREAEQKLLSVNRDDYLDAMVVLEEGMRHFYIRAVQLKTANGNPKEIDDNLLKDGGYRGKGHALPPSSAGRDQAQQGPDHQWAARECLIGRSLEACCSRSLPIRQALL